MTNDDNDVNFENHTHILDYLAFSKQLDSGWGFDASRESQKGSRILQRRGRPKWWCSSPRQSFLAFRNSLQEKDILNTRISGEGTARCTKVNGLVGPP